jgi:alpha-N-arabinofuranosidase
MKKLLLLLAILLSVPTAQGQSLATYAFDQPLGPEWVYIQTPDTTKYNIGFHRLRLYGSVSTLTKGERPTFVGRRQEGTNLLMVAHVYFRESYQGDEAGLCIYRDNDFHAEICLEGTREKMQVSFKATQKELTARFAEVEIDSYEAWLQIRSNGEQYFYEYSLDGKDYKTLYKISCSLLSPEAGILCGMYCTKKNATYLTYANFDEFRFENE